jgi:GNAT superfamily N-acetyltransferase
MDSPALAIRSATAADSRVLATQRVAMFREMGQLQSSQDAPLLDASEAWFAAAIPAGDYVAWLAHAAEGATTGGAGVQRRAMLPRPVPNGDALLIGSEGVVLNVYVEQAWRRRGIARRLMQTVIQWAPAAGIVRLVLHPSDEGLHLYESLGFVPTRELQFTGSLTPAGKDHR